MLWILEFVRHASFNDLMDQVLREKDIRQTFAGRVWHAGYIEKIISIQLTEGSAKGCRIKYSVYYITFALVSNSLFVIIN